MIREPSGNGRLFYIINTTTGIFYSVNKGILTSIILILGNWVLQAQMLPEKGVPMLRNYPPALYQNQGKIWDMGSAPNHILYLAADGGLLEFDGKSWQVFKGSQGFTRSLLVMNDSLIYTGSDLDFGVWKKQADRSFSYTSLYPFKEDVQEVNEEFWDVHPHEGSIIFASSQSIYIYKNEQLTRINAPHRITGSFIVQGNLYIADGESGLYVLDQFTIKHLHDNPGKADFIVSGMYSRDGVLTIVTRNDGIFTFSEGKLGQGNSALSAELKKSMVFSFSRVGDHYLAFGTVLKGLFITDLDGNIIHRINKYKGLLSNTILSLHYSPGGKLWLSADYGLSSLFLRNDITYVYDYRGDFGTSCTAILKDDDYYLGTNQGLYHTKWDDLNNDKEFFQFNLIPGTQGQVWTLKQVDNAVFMGHDKGLFRIIGQQVDKLSGSEGVWTILPHGRYLLTGNYNGISVYRKEAENWVFTRKMDLISGSCNQLLLEKKNILWVNIPNYGIIRATLDSNLHPSERFIYPIADFQGSHHWITFKDGVIKVLTDKGQFGYDEVENKWTMEKPDPAIPNIENLLPGFYTPDELNESYDFFPLYNGFALKFRGYEEEIISQKVTLLFRSSFAFNNHGSMVITPGIKLPYRLNNVKIEYIVPHHDKILYQYKLDEDGAWSAWTSDNMIELMGLGQGSHTIYVNAGVDGRVLDAGVFTFRVAAPWYGRWYSILLYVLMAVMAVFIIKRWNQRSLRRQEESMKLQEQSLLQQQEEKHHEAIVQMEREQLMQEYEHVRQQLTAKTLELARKARDNEAKNRLLYSLKEKFESVGADGTLERARLSEIRKLLEVYIKTDDRIFEIQLDELHQEFFLRMKSKFPNLSNNDLRLCAYLKIGLNSKEIAELLNIQPSSAFISRSRLRKKLNLDSDEELYDFLNKI